MSFKINNIFFLSLLILYLFIISYFWNEISIPLINKNNVIGELTLKGFNPLNDTLRFFLFTGPVFLITYFYLKYNFHGKFTGIKKLTNFHDARNENLKIKDVIFFKIIFFFFISLEFLSINFSDYIYLDSLHDGDYLTPLKNYQYYKGLWSSSFVIHGGRDLFIPILSSKIFGNFNIAPVKFFYIFCIYLIKLLSIILSFQLSKFTNLEKRYKIIIFILSTFFLLSLSNYQQNDYLNLRDLFVVVFFIFFIQLILNKNSFLSKFFFTLTTVVAIYFHYDTGIYLSLILILYLVYLLVESSFMEFVTISIFFILNILLSLYLFGLNEIGDFYNQIIHIILNIDKIHGLEYPKPFFSIGEMPDAARATKLLVFFILIGLVINFTIFLKNKFLHPKEKILILFIYIYSLISYKNALGRSDSDHMMISSDWITILMFYYLLFSSVLFIKDKFNNYLNLNRIIKILPLVLIATIFVQYYDKEILRSYEKISSYLKIPNSKFLPHPKSDERKEILKEIYQIIKNESCINNFTVDLSLPYLFDKPTCSKFFSSWIVSGKKTENEYINSLKKEKSKFIIYTSSHFKVDKIPTNKRLKVVDSYIKQNYYEVYKYRDYSIVKKKR